MSSPQSTRQIDAMPVAEPEHQPDVPTLLRTIAALTLDNERLRAEKAERDAPVWLPLKLAAYRAELPYEKARAWAARAILAGCVNEARKDGGRVMVNVTALIAHRMHMPLPL